MESTQPHRACSYEGCEYPLSARGYCRTHYEQFRRGKPLTEVIRRSGGTVADRIAAYTDRSGECWVWTRAIGKDGYARLDVDGIPRLVHRLVYAAAHGPIADGLEVDHKCHNRSCVRVEHLHAVTKKQNGENRAGPQRNGTSGVRGVSWSKSRRGWETYVGHRGVLHHAGVYSTIEEADAAVVAKRLELHTNNLLDRVRV